MTAGPGARAAAILELLRPVADELVVALDDRAADETLDAVAAVADRVVRYPFAEPVDRPLPWLFDICSCEWMLTIDDDEVPSVALLEELPALCGDRRIVHYSLARRWVFPDTASFLAEPPWQPDYQLRLFRRDPRLIRFSDRLHRPIHAEGPGRFVAAPLWHLDTAVRTRAQRSAKAAAYERARPGMRAAGRALNYAFYVPELRPDARLERVPELDRTLLESILHAEPPRGPRRAELSGVTREEIDAHWPASRALQSGEVAIVRDPGSFATGEERAVDVRVRNTGASAWDWGSDPVVGVHCAAYWEPDPHTAAHWTPLPSPVAPGESIVVPVHARAPQKPGRHVLRIALVHEEVQWLDGAATCAIDVRDVRRVAFVGATDADIDAAVSRDPDIDPVVVTADLLLPATANRLALATGLAWRTVAAIVRPPRSAFGGARALVVGSAPALRRERWARRALLVVGRRCGARRA